ncbi:MAG: lysophospholipid acyltransferase family protein [Mycolicibacterium insubricum]
MEPVFRTLEIASALALRAAGSKVTNVGIDNIPAVGGAVVAINHTSYIDWLPAGLSTRPLRRRMRFMIKAEMTRVPGVNFLITRARTIPVDRSAGAGAYSVAVDNLRAGELVAVYPEATISRSFELKEFKSGAARMALEADVPIIPMIVWGAHRIWTKDRPRRLGRHKIPITVAVGAPIPPSGEPAELDARLHTAMAGLLEDVIGGYPYPPGAHWMPARLGGSAPTPREAAERDAAEAAERARKRAEGTSL